MKECRFPKPIADWIDAQRKAHRVRQYENAKKALRIMVDMKDPEIYNQMTDIAQTMAKRMCMTWLDNKGINHCSRCPNTAPLLTLNDVYFCQGHFPHDKHEPAEIRIVSK